ncbi:hypothetical protein LMJ53_14065 [Rheinheimera sp. UJ51]|uniref:hypothetical protein n=1 Tax=unclassified Rheinheimera TaxID=115860 RepID=UPI001E643A9F|nr:MULTISPECIES: hypothetical protein [unclassified Rheinheimera]MCC5452849.1 hypothetical protein [Rheinheimera sp. UJ51]MCF4010542.1 hypothetical protein [Rheinheimera sp. UJ63]
MSNNMAQLQKIYAASQAKHQQFTEQSGFQWQEYSGCMVLSANTELPDVLQFRSPFNPTGFTPVINKVALPKTTALATLQQRYGTTFTHAISILFY